LLITFIIFGFNYSPIENMKKLIFGLSVVLIFASCSQTNGQLVGVQEREEWFQPDPYGMLYIPQGSFHMGPNDEDASGAFTTKQKMVSMPSFYMDETEISNNEYRQFVYWVRDSIARSLLAESGNFDDDFRISQEDYLSNYPIYKGDDNLQEYYLNWNSKLDYGSGDDDYRLALQPLYIPSAERFYNRKQIDSRKLNYEYYRIDMRLAASKSNRFVPQKSPDNQTVDYKKNNFINGVNLSDGKTKSTPTGDPTKDPNVLGSYNVKDQLAQGSGNYQNRERNGVDRSVFVVKDVVNVYPDTLAWIHDFTYSFNEPLTNNYFWHPAFDNYPVVGVSWKQARAFCIWRSLLLNNFLSSGGSAIANDFRLPSEAEWEYASRGGNDMNSYPWGGPYIRNARGCFLANFKPMRGVYTDDGGLTTVSIYSYPINDYGLYNMSGNAAEWTRNAYDESAYEFMHDMSPDYEYEATDREQNVLKRKVIRGGSWKDIGHYLQVGTRTYEYQDTAKCYVGFRSVMHFLGRAKGDEL
jgi:formylglycine-generating enzyme